eukprot:CAMPEP_0172519804 /NCGR_PEP_ID=MMETSP1066-20121228/291633_1 /TAXON_ID=671091 /ORGANISM="Coscinodiscus wailesii, Strain CCMP2513" /LENGTH=63 /DNA_ID=CAMNT_0013302457 /DNA_START=321 /DNA_END=511 /DNA_ORIENTATION=+
MDARSSTVVGETAGWGGKVVYRPFCGGDDKIDGGSNDKEEDLSKQVRDIIGKLPILDYLWKEV